MKYEKQIKEIIERGGYSKRSLNPTATLERFAEEVIDLVRKHEALSKPSQERNIGTQAEEALREVIAAGENYKRFGATSVFEGNDMVYAAVLEGLVEQASSAIAQLATLDWKPMDSAPRDGTVIMACLGLSDIAYPIRFSRGAWEMVWGGYRPSGPDTPVKWMPLPD